LADQLTRCTRPARNKGYARPIENPAFDAGMVFLVVFYFLIPFFRKMIPMNPAKAVPKSEKCFSLPAAPVKYR